MNTHEESPYENSPLSAEVSIGKKLRDLRISRGFSLRSLADRSGLNVNTLSLIENGKSSPSVSTLQQLAQALNVPIGSFFTSEPAQKRVVFTSAQKRPQISFGSTKMDNLGKDLAGNAVQPFIVTLQPGMGSGERKIIHTGYELVLCLNGCIHYQIEEEEYWLKSGDSLVFEAHLPHCWENAEENIAQFLLVLYPTDERDEPVGRHFPPEILKKELTMKIAVITEDGKNISQHFGRAPYYLVFSIERGEVVNQELRNKPRHHTSTIQAHSEEHHTRHGQDETSHQKHISMAEVITDCKVLICGGMGRGAYESMRQLNIQPIVTDIRDINDAIQAFIDGKLIDHTELLH